MIKLLELLARIFNVLLTKTWYGVKASYHQWQENKAYKQGNVERRFHHAGELVSAQKKLGVIK